MAVITPVGKMNFDWSPVQEKETVVKTASTAAGKPAKSVKAKTDKDFLYETAKKIVAQFGSPDMAEEEVDDVEGAEGAETSTDMPDVGDDSEVAEVSEDLGDVAEDVEGAADSEGATGDVQKAVAELVEKAEKADDMAEKIEEAVAKVEEAAEAVRSAVGGGEMSDVSGSESDVAEIEIEDAGDEVAEIEIEVADESPVSDEGMSDEGGEDIIQESVEDCKGCGAMASAKAALAKEASVDDFVKTSKISPTTRKKVLKLWKTDLQYAPDYCNLMVKNYEK